MNRRRLQAAAQGFARDERGQAITETALLYFGIISGVIVSLMAFAPDMLAAITIYLRGFYLVLGYPLG